MTPAVACSGGQWAGSRAWPGGAGERGPPPWWAGREEGGRPAVLRVHVTSWLVKAQFSRSELIQSEGQAQHTVGFVY